MKNLFLRKKKCLDFILEKKENLFQLFDDLGGKGKEEYFCTVQFFL